LAILFASRATRSTAAAGSRSGADARPDHDGNQAAETRRNLFGALCDTATLLRGAFPSPSVGRLVRRREAFDFVAM